MPKLITLNEIKPILKNIDVINLMQEAFIQYSNGNTVIPPVGELVFNDPPGDVHIKYGYIKREDFYVIKIASGFYENYKLDIPSGQGMMLLFSQKTGKLESILLDEGYLTNIRTAAAGALAVKHFSPSKTHSIGIVGSGIQARLQLEYIQKNNPCKKVFIWGRNKNRIKKFYLEIKNHFDVEIRKHHVNSNPLNFCWGEGEFYFCGFYKLIYKRAVHNISMTVPVVVLN